MLTASTSKRVRVVSRWKSRLKRLAKVKQNMIANVSRQAPEMVPSDACEQFDLARLEAHQQTRSRHRLGTCAAAYKLIDDVTSIRLKGARGVVCRRRRSENSGAKLRVARHTVGANA